VNKVFRLLWNANALVEKSAKLIHHSISLSDKVLRFIFVVLADVNFFAADRSH